MRIRVDRESSTLHSRLDESKIVESERKCDLVLLSTSTSRIASWASSF